MDTIIQRLFTNWTWVRALYLVFGLILVVQAIRLSEPIYGFIALYALISALTNSGCAGGACSR